MSCTNEALIPNKLTRHWPKNKKKKKAINHRFQINILNLLTSDATKGRFHKRDMLSHESTAPLLFSLVASRSQYGDRLQLTEGRGGITSRRQELNLVLDANKMSTQMDAILHLCDGSFMHGKQFDMQGEQMC